MRVLKKGIVENSNQQKREYSSRKEKRNKVQHDCIKQLKSKHSVLNKGDNQEHNAEIVDTKREAQ